jgi:hypothetical protein
MTAESVNVRTDCNGSRSSDDQPFLEKDMNSRSGHSKSPRTAGPLNNYHESPQTAGPSNNCQKSPRTAGRSNNCPKTKKSSSAGKSVNKQSVNPLPASSTDDQWLNTSTHAGSGKRKRSSDGTEKGEKLNRGAKRQLLEEEERSWLGMEGVKTGRVSTAVGPGTTEKNNG